MTTETKPAALAFVQLSRDLWRSVGSRFDLIRAPGYWVAIDGNTGRTARAPTRVACARWCERVAEGKL